MTDDRLRELERRFRESGSVEDEAGWLIARIDAGKIDKLLVHLAQRFGHEASRKIYCYPESNLKPRAVSQKWTEDLLALIYTAEPELFSQLSTRLMAACFLQLYPSWEEDGICVQAMHVVSQWLHSSSSALVDQARAIHVPGFNVEPTLGIWNALAVPEAEPASLATIRRRGHLHHVVEQVAAVALSGQEAHRVLRNGASGFLYARSSWMYENRVALGRRLIPWLLAYNADPLLEELNRRLSKPGP